MQQKEKGGGGVGWGTFDIYIFSSSKICFVYSSNSYLSSIYKGKNKVSSLDIGTGVSVR